MAPSSTSPPPSSKNGFEPENNLWEVTDIPGKGKGVVALTDIEPGTLVISEKPLITTDVITSYETVDKDIARYLKTQPKANQRAFLSLHNNFPGEGSPLSNIVRSNGYPLGPGSEVGGVFRDLSRVNHSCRPNCVHSWNAKLEKETVYAVRKIKEGEELTTSYHAGGPSSTRKEILKEAFRFDCTCELCSLPENKLKASDARLIRAQNLDSSIGDSKNVRFSPGRVLKNCKSLMGLYEQEGIKDDRLSRLYFDIFQICNMHGDKARASVWAERYCAEKVLSAGEESTDRLEMLPFVKRPEKHDSFGSTKNWASEVKSVPRELESEEFEKWLWRENI